MPSDTPLRGSAPRRLIAGMRYPLRGARVVLSRRGLAALSVAPILITTVLYVTGLVLVFANLGDLVGTIWAYPEPERWWGWLLVGLWYLVYPVVVVLVLGLAYVSIIAVANVVAAPFNEVISEKVEAIARGRDVAPPFTWRGFLGDVARGLGHTAKHLLLLAAVLVPILLVGLVGLAPVSAVLGVGATALFLALEYLDPTMSRARLDFPTKRRIVLGNAAPCLGFGLAVYVILLVPFLAVFCIPACVAGATLLYVDLVPDGGGGAPVPAPVPGDAAERGA